MLLAKSQGNFCQNIRINAGVGTMTPFTQVFWCPKGLRDCACIDVGLFSCESTS